KEQLHLILPDYAVRDEVVENIQRRLTNTSLGRTQPAALQSIQHSQNLIAAAAHAQIVDDLVLQNAIGVDDEQSTKRQVATFDEYTVCFADFPVWIARQGEREMSDAALRR